MFIIIYEMHIKIYHFTCIFGGPGLQIGWIYHSNSYIQI